MAALQKLTDDFLTCIICQGVFKDPATLHCGHTFCGVCITSYVLSRPEAQAEQSIPCPHCRGLTKVPDPHRPVEEWASQLKTGFFVKGLVETFVAEDTVDDATLCSVCKEAGEATPADKWCADCNEALCSKCLQMHTQYPKFREHKTAELAEGLKLQQSAQKHFCPEHKDEKLKLFCKDCDKAICQLCCSVFHRKCDSVVTLSEAYPQMKQDLSGKVFDMQFAIVKSESIVSERKSQLSTLIESCDQAVSDVDSACEAFIKSIQDKQANVKKKITKQTDYAARLLTKDLETAASKCKEMELNVATIQSAITSATEIELYDTYKTHCSTCDREPESEPESGEKEAKPRVIEINFKSNSDQLIKSLHKMNIGTLSSEYDHREESDRTEEAETETGSGTGTETGSEANKEPSGPRGKQRAKTPRKDKKRGADLPRTDSVPGAGGKGNLSSKFTSEENLSSKGAGRKPGPRTKGVAGGSGSDVSPVLVDHIEVKADIDQNDPHIEDIITVPDGDSVIIVFSDIQNRKVKALYRRNNQKFFVEFQHPPSGLTQVSDNEVAVTVSLGFRIYIIQPRPHLQIVSHIDTKKGYSHICHIDGNRFAASSGDKAIDILDSSGNVTKRLENDQISKSIIYKTNMPGQILVCDPDTHSVSRMSINNKTSFKYDPYGKHRLVNAVGAGMDYKGNIYVVNRGCNKVVMLNGAGKFVKPVLSMEDSVEKLAYIAFDKSNRMYLTYEEKFIYVYQL